MLKHLIMVSVTAIKERGGGWDHIVNVSISAVYYTEMKESNLVWVI